MPYTRRTKRRRAPVRRRRRTYRRRAPVRRRRRVTKRKPISKFTLAQVNPFSSLVAGVKIPDLNTQPSTTVVVEDDYAVATDATYQVAARGFRPFTRGQVVTATAASSTGWTWPAGFGSSNNSSKLSAILANYESARTCAHGVRITCPLAPNNVIGYVHICVIAENTFGQSTWNFPTDTSTMATSQWYKKIPLARLTMSPVIVVNKIIDGTAFLYIDPSSDRVDNAGDLAFQTSGFGTILIAVTGAGASTTAINVENIMHLEAIPTVGSAQSVSPAAPADPEIQARASTVASTTDAVHDEGILESFRSGVRAAVGDAAGQLYDTVLGNAPAAGRAFGNWALGQVFAGGNNRLMLTNG